MALVGCYVALSKPLVAALPVFLLAWMRFGIAALAMLHWMKRPADELPMTRSTRRLLFMESFFGNFLFSLCMLSGVSMTSAVSAGVIMSTIPAIIAVMSWLFLKERIGLRIAAATACGAFGIGMFSLTKHAAVGIAAPSANDFFAGHQAWVGNALVFGAVLCEGAYAVIGKKLTGTLSPKRISALINLWGFCLMTPLGLYTAWTFHFAQVQASSWLLLVFYALAASVWSVWLWMSGLKNVPASHAGIFSVMLPIAAALVGVLVLGESLTGGQLFAFAIALFGVVLATLPGRK
jgi:drug/metabolite transporter (DMT)-like permease